MVFWRLLLGMVEVTGLNLVSPTKISYKNSRLRIIPSGCFCIYINDVNVSGFLKMSNRSYFVFSPFFYN